MKKLVVIIFSLILIGLISACSNNQSAGNNEGSDKSSSAITGNEVFQKSCITCHSSGDINGGQVNLDSVKIHNDFKDKSSLYTFVSNNMPKSSPGSYQRKNTKLWLSIYGIKSNNFRLKTILMNPQPVIRKRKNNTKNHLQKKVANR